MAEVFMGVVDRHRPSADGRGHPPITSRASVLHSTFTRGWRSIPGTSRRRYRTPVAGTMLALITSPPWPPVAIASITTVDSPSEAPYTAAASPAGPEPMTSASQRPSSGREPMMRKPAPAPTSRARRPR
ncbi:hypothetical protein ACH4U7_08505 [Streptomyces sp. NPDC020845]|uniref:hypothetical protein n=1 Tax=Streptomyces sp. NPDC020845 TaxID=3365096 RepID=UPI00378CC180